MAQPATGADWTTSGLAYFDTLRIRRGGQWAVLVRDYKGSDTNISPGSAFVSPMSLDGKWRDDLLAIVKVAGKWVYNPLPNLGFYPIGTLHPDGIERAPKVDSDELEILQSIDPARVDMQKRTKTLMFTPRENSPVVNCIQFNRPLVNVLESAAAAGTYFASESSDTEFVERQVLVMHEDRGGGKVERNCFPFSRSNLTDLGSQKGNKKDVDESKITLTRILDPFFIGADGKPAIDGRWTSGELWTEAFTTGFTFGHDAPAATALTATTASLVFPVPIGGVSPYTYVYKKSASALMTSPTTVTGTPTVTAGVVTAALTGLTTATTSYFQVTATDSTSGTALEVLSKPSNAATQP